MQGLFGKDQVDTTRHRPLHQLRKLWTALDRGSGQPLVRKDAGKGPCWMAGDILLEEPALGGKGVELILLIGGNAAVSGYPQGRPLAVGHCAFPNTFLSVFTGVPPPMLHPVHRDCRALFPP